MNKGCCDTCKGTGTSYDIETNGQCWDCSGTGHAHELRIEMGKSFVLAEPGVGPGGDIIFRKHKGADGWYNVFLDDVKIGIIMKDPCWGNWNALSHCEESKWFAVRTMDGFSTRMGAATFIIKHHGYWLSNEREMQGSLIRAEKFLTKFKMNKAREAMKGHSRYAI